MKPRKIYYAFDFTGELLASGTNQELSKICKVTESAIMAALARGSIVDEKFYFQRSKKFNPPRAKKANWNPLMKSGEHHSYNKSRKSNIKYTEHDKYCIAYKWFPDKQLAVMYNTSINTIRQLRSKILFEFNENKTMTKKER
jgi:hypothetical protein